MKDEYYLTIDVGTKNLALCLSSYTKDDNTKNILENINIIDWNILDVSFKSLYCKEIKNKRAICNCVAKYYSLKEGTEDHSNSENLIGYCKKHTNIIRKNNKNKENIPIKLFKISSNPIYKNNFNTQIEKLLRALNDYYNNIILKPYHIIDNKLLFIKKLKIFIENQPVFKNPIMKSISVAIFTFFSLKKIQNNNIIKDVNFINAIVKTKKDFIEKIGDIFFTKSLIKNFNLYNNRKNFSEDIVNQFILKLNYSNKNFNNIINISNYIIIKKKDDLADTFLYLIYLIIYSI